MFLRFDIFIDVANFNFQRYGIRIFQYIREFSHSYVESFLGTFESFLGVLIFLRKTAMHSSCVCSVNY